MSETKAERLAGALDEFLSATPDVEAAAVVSFDGLAMASALPASMDEDRLGAMSAALLSLGEQAAHGLGRGELQQVFVEAEAGYVFLMSARDQAVLAAVTDRAAKIGLMLFEMRRAADAIGGILEGATAEHPSMPLPAAPDGAGGAGTHLRVAAAQDDEEHTRPEQTAQANGASPAGTVLPPWN